MKRSYRDSSIAAGETLERPRSMVDQLRRLRPLIERHGTRDQKVAFNAAIAAAKGLRFDICDSKYGYGPGARPAVEAAQFAEMVKQYHRKNPDEVQLRTPSGLLG